MNRFAAQKYCHELCYKRKMLRLYLQKTSRHGPQSRQSGPQKPGSFLRKTLQRGKGSINIGKTTKSSEINQKDKHEKNLPWTDLQHKGIAMLLSCSCKNSHRTNLTGGKVNPEAWKHRTVGKQLATLKPTAARKKPPRNLNRLHRTSLQDIASSDCRFQLELHVWPDCSCDTFKTVHQGRTGGTAWMIWHVTVLDRNLTAAHREPSAWPPDWPLKKLAQSNNVEVVWSGGTS